MHAHGVRWWRDALPGVPDGALARAGGARARGGGAQGALPQPLLLGARREPAAAASPEGQQRYVRILRFLSQIVQNIIFSGMNN